MGCGCAAVLLGSMFPRVGLIITWLFTDRIDMAFDGWALPVLGWFFVAFGFVLDLSSYFGGERFNSRRRYRY